MRVLLLAVLGIVVSDQVQPSKDHEVLCSESSPAAVEDSFAWQEKGPLEFLEFLKELHDESKAALGYVVRCEHRGWVTEADLPGLMALLDSIDECVGVVSPLSSWLPSEPSTVGREALFLVDGYRKGVYPPGLASQRHGASAEEVRAWWQQYQSDRLTPR
jgi:hypothetical protein